MQAIGWTNNAQSKPSENGKIVQFPKDSTVENSSSVEERVVGVVEASMFPLDIKIPVYVNPGERVTIRLIREQVQTTSTAGDLYTQSSKLPKWEPHSPLSFNDGSVTESDDYDFFAGKEQKGTYSTEKIYNGDKEKNKVTGEEKVEGTKDYHINLLTKISNFSIGLFVFSAAVFLLLSITNIFISTTDAIFGFLLSVITAGVFYFDKLYRRNLNSESRQ
jgi:hypothetical protein